MATGRLIAFGDAARLLQEFMPNKNAREWLLNDARHEPVIPCILRGGEPHYDMSDLAHFVVRFLDPMARVGTIPPSATLGRGALPERRRADRRVNPPLLLAPGVERRNYARGDRRGAEVERRVRTVH